MKNKNAFTDPLSDVTRKERKFLVLFSGLSIAIVLTGLLPTKISALGVDFTEANQTAILLILIAVIVYYLFSFGSTLYYDYKNWQRNINNEVADSVFNKLRDHSVSQRNLKSTIVNLIEGRQVEVEEKLLHGVLNVSENKKIVVDETYLKHLIKVAQKNVRQESLLRKLLDIYFPFFIGCIAVLLLLSQIARV
jgi:hypothetical protein